MLPDTLSAFSCRRWSKQEAYATRLGPPFFWDVSDSHKCHHPTYHKVRKQTTRYCAACPPRQRECGWGWKGEWRVPASSSMGVLTASIAATLADCGARLRMTGSIGTRHRLSVERRGTSARGHECSVAAMGREKRSRAKWLLFTYVLACTEHTG